MMTEVFRSLPKPGFFNPFLGDIAHSMGKDPSERLRIQDDFLEFEGMAMVIDDRDLVKIEHIRLPPILFMSIEIRRECGICCIILSLI
jgi:hypothetical protein